MVNDHLSDFVARVRNGYMANRETIETRPTKLVVNFAEVLKTAGYIKDHSIEEQVMTVTLKYNGSKPAIMGIKRVSKPGARVYSAIKDVPGVLSGLGINILSTPKGVMSHKAARKLGVGGEILAQVW